MRQLILSEVQTIAGGLALGETQATYAPLLPGYEIIGWKQTLVGYDTYYGDTVHVGFWDTIQYVERVPVYTFDPIYSPMVQPAPVVVW